MDIAEFCSDYIAMLIYNGGPMPTRLKLAREIVVALEDRGVDATVEQVLYYLSY